MANLVDTDDDIVYWVRRHVGELPILWNSGGQEDNPDLIVIERDGTHDVVAVTMNKERPSVDVLGTREAARRWANHITADSRTATRRYLLVSESDVDTAKGSWAV